MRKSSSTHLEFEDNPRDLHEERFWENFKIRADLRGTKDAHKCHSNKFLKKSHAIRGQMRRIKNNSKITKKIAKKIARDETKGHNLIFGLIVEVRLQFTFSPINALDGKTLKQ